jgi:hypothetical protein
MRTTILSTVAIALLGSVAIGAQAQQQAPQMNPDLASFFVAENPNGTGNLGGLAGADQICQSQAQAIGGRAAQRPTRSATAGASSTWLPAFRGRPIQQPSGRPLSEASRLG